MLVEGRTARAVDDAGTGVVLTSIHGRSDARSYAKTLLDWESDQPLSPEEDAVIAAARSRSLGELPAPVPARPRAKVGRRSEESVPAASDHVDADVDADAAIAEQVEREVTVRETRGSGGSQTA